MYCQITAKEWREIGGDTLSEGVQDHEKITVLVSEVQRLKGEAPAEPASIPEPEAPAEPKIELEVADSNVVLPVVEPPLGA